MPEHDEVEVLGGTAVCVTLELLLLGVIKRIAPPCAGAEVLQLRPFRIATHLREVFRETVLLLLQALCLNISFRVSALAH